MQLGLAVVGGLAFGPIGFLAGSLIGAWLFAPRQTNYGPRLDDLRPSTSTYGIPIPIGYGTVRMPGNVIWSEDFVEHKIEEEVGKGASVKNVYYKYTCSFAICFANRQSEKVIKIYADKKIIYDSSGVTGEIPPSIMKDGGLKFKFYDGTQTEPDPVIEAVEGVNDTPAYKGFTYIVFEDLPLEDFGNRRPNIEADICFASDPAYPETTYSPSILSSEYARNYPFDNFVIDHVRGYAYYTGRHVIIKINLWTNEIVRQVRWPLYDSNYRVTYGWHCVDQDGFLWMNFNIYSNYAFVFKINPVTLQWTNFYAGTRQGIWGGYGAMPASSTLFSFNIPEWENNKKVIFALGPYGFSSTKLAVFSRDKLVGLTNVNNDPRRLEFLGETWIGARCFGLDLDKNNDLWVSTDTGYLVQYKLRYIPRLDDPKWSDYEVVFERVNTINLIAYGATTHTIKYWIDEHAVILVKNDYVIKYDIDSGNITTYYNIHINPYNFTRQSNQSTPIHQGQLWFSDAHNTWVINLSSMELFEQYSHLDFNNPPSRFVGHPQTQSLFGSYSGGMSRIWFGRIASGQETLQSVVEDICSRCGLDVSNDIDASDLANYYVKGFALHNQTNGKTALEFLSMGYIFDGYETDWKLKFERRGKDSSFTIDDQYLGADLREGDENKAVENFKQEIELPEELTINFIDKDRDYQQNSALQKRMADVVNSGQKQSLDIPIVFQVETAKQLVDKWMAILWTERNTYQTTLPPRFIAIDPTDVGTLTIDDDSFTVRVNSCKIRDGHVIDIEAIEEDSYIYDSEITGYGGEWDGQTLPVLGPTELILIDTNLLRDTDLSSSYNPLYFGGSGISSDWKGAGVFRSVDNLLYNEIGFIDNAATWGYTTTKLNNFTRWASWDYISTVTVYPASGTLSSATELAVLNGANAMAVKINPRYGEGWEIIQFQTATNNGDGTYTLSNLLRGRRGTDFYVDKHMAGDLFILLTESTIEKYSAETGDIGNTRYYKAVTPGYDSDFETFYELSLSGSAFKPYSVSDIRASRDVFGNVTFTWERRTRANGAWKDSTGTVPLNEDSESYVIEILNSTGTTVKRTISGLTSETSTYSATDQITDFGGVQSSIRVNIYQISALVGRGYPGIATV